MMFDNPVYIKSNYDGWGCITLWSGRLSEGTRLPLGGVTAVPDWEGRIFSLYIFFFPVILIHCVF